MLWEEAQDETDLDEDDEDEGTRPVAEPVGDPALLTDLGTSSDVLLELCAEEGLRPADVLTGIAERAGFLDVLASLRDGCRAGTTSACGWRSGKPPSRRPTTTFR